MIGTTELAIVDVLRQAGGSSGGALGYDYRSFDTFPDEFDEYLRDNSHLKLPACWAVFLGLVDGEDFGSDLGWQGRARFALVVAAKNLRNEEDTRHGDGATPGSYQLAIDAIRLLSRNDLSGYDAGQLELVEPITVRSARLVGRTPTIKQLGLSLIAIELECVLPTGAFTGDADDFLSLHVDWDVPPIGNVAAPLPAANPDAEDLIEVPQ
jgi:phage gp37-like protein